MGTTNLQPDGNLQNVPEPVSRAAQEISKALHDAGFDQIRAFAIREFGKFKVTLKGNGEAANHEAFVQVIKSLTPASNALLEYKITFTGEHFYVAQEV